MLPQEKNKNDEIRCILKCLLVKFEAMNSLEIYNVHIATTTKKVSSLLAGHDFLNQRKATDN